jgi:hypothetical protein
VIEHPSGPIKYSDRYDIRIKDFDIEFPEDDEVIEPGE